jgi:hypothetical protein
MFTIFHTVIVLTTHFFYNCSIMKPSAASVHQPTGTSFFAFRHYRKSPTFTGTL